MNLSENVINLGINHLCNDLLIDILLRCDITCLFVCNKWFSIITDEKNNIVKTCDQINRLLGFDPNKSILSTELFLNLQVNLKCNRIITYNSKIVFKNTNYRAFYDNKKQISKPSDYPLIFTFALYPVLYEPSNFIHKCQCGKSNLH